MSEGKAQAIVDAILSDHNGRRGLRHEWDNIDEEIQEEIRQEWIGIVEAHLEPTPKAVEVTEEKLRAAWDKWIAYAPCPSPSAVSERFPLFKKELGL